MPWASLASAVLLIAAFYLVSALLFRLIVPRAGRMAGALKSVHGRIFPDRPGESDGWLVHHLRLRLDPHPFRGLPLTLLIAVALYAAILFSGLTEDVLETGALDSFDGVASALVQPWRVEPALTWFRWISAIAGGPAILAVLMVSTGFLLLQTRRTPILALWTAFAGAQLTTTLGKTMIGRPRPEPMYDVAALAAFPSGHATVVMAVYGFLGYLIARQMSEPLARFHVAFATLVAVALVGLSRVVLNVHFASDVAGGYLVGLFWLLLGVILVEGRQRSSEASAP